MKNKRTIFISTGIVFLICLFSYLIIKSLLNQKEESIISKETVEGIIRDNSSKLPKAYEISKAARIHRVKTDVPELPEPLALPKMPANEMLRLPDSPNLPKALEITKEKPNVLELPKYPETLQVPKIGAPRFPESPKFPKAPGIPKFPEIIKYSTFPVNSTNLGKEKNR